LEREDIILAMLLSDGKDYSRFRDNPEDNKIRANKMLDIIKKHIGEKDLRLRTMTNLGFRIAELLIERDKPTRGAVRDELLVVPCPCGYTIHLVTSTSSQTLNWITGKEVKCHWTGSIPYIVFEPKRIPQV